MRGLAAGDDAVTCDVAAPEPPGHVLGKARSVTPRPGALRYRTPSRPPPRRL